MTFEDVHTQQLALTIGNIFGKDENPGKTIPLMKVLITGQH